MSIFRDIQDGVKKSGTPATAALVFAVIGAYLISWFSAGKFFGLDLAFHPVLASAKPWTMILYPFASPPTGAVAVCILFAALWLWGIGGSVERDLGAGRYLGFFFIMTVLCALTYWAGEVLTGDPAVLWGSFVGIAAVTIAWGVRNPTSCVQLMFVLPITGKWLAWLAAALVFLSTDSPKLAAFACIPLILAWAFAADKLPIAYKGVYRSKRVRGGIGSPHEKAYYDEVRKREQDRKERERLRKLFEGSLSDDPDKDR